MPLAPGNAYIFVLWTPKADPFKELGPNNGTIPLFVEIKNKNKKPAARMLFVAGKKIKIKNLPHALPRDKFLKKRKRGPQAMF